MGEQSNPYSPPQSPLRDPPDLGFSWRAALLGGAVAIAAAAFFGTLTSNITLWVLTTNGLSPQDAWTELFNSTEYSAVGYAISVLSNGCGGYAASALAPRGFVPHSASAGAVSLAFVLITFATPVSFPTNELIALQLLIPIPAAILGGYVYAWRT